MGKKNKQGGLVYSTECGRVSNKTSSSSADNNKATKLAPGQSVEVQRQTKGRKGSGVIVIRNLPLGKADLSSFAKHLKQKSGTGGTVKGNTIEIQGENCDLIMDEIQKQGWKVKKTGG